MQLWKRRIKEGGAQQKALAQTVERDDFPCVVELSRVKLVKMVLQEKIVTANTRI